MTAFLLVAAVAVLLTVAGALVRVVRGPTTSDRMMGAQLIGTGGIAALLLAGTASRLNSTSDVALVLAILAPFAMVAFRRYAAATQAAASRERRLEIDAGAPGAAPPQGGA
ncbi:MAG TPA: monovalent cation/H+ antiporter complex subunit F [Phycisphaerales bacterium]|nr:monovalent cation/H+ antiporter complex subunit F [Phycisphaerales bacterium]HMP36688.1 monovalent cation/H+ antiporter complex subunit F [Phycisphaerales bacterium]